jgi:hypothetical protein
MCTYEEAFKPTYIINTDRAFLMISLLSCTPAGNWEARNLICTYGESFQAPH